MNPLDQPGVPFELELLNPNPSGRRTKDGPVYRISFEVDKAAYDSFMASRYSNLRLAARMVVMPDTDEEEAQEALEIGKKEKKLKVVKGAYGSLWQALHQSSIWNVPGIREAIEDERKHVGEDEWQILHRLFGVVSMSEVSADDVRAKFPPEQFPQLDGVLQSAERKLAA